MKRAVKWFFLLGLTLIFMSVHSPAAASVSVTMTGQLERDMKYGGEVVCNTTDYLDMGQDIELSSYFTQGTKTMNYVTGYRVAVNGALYNQYQVKILDCRVPFEVWHAHMTDDMHVNVQVIVDTTVGKAIYDFQLEVSRESVKPVCAEHVFGFEVTDTESAVCRCCEEDPEYHYLESCMGRYVCAVCGEATETARFEFTEQNSPLKMIHSLGPDNRCVAVGCGYEKTVRVIRSMRLIVEADGRWEPGRLYRVEAVWEPEDIVIEDLAWDIKYTGIYNNEEHGVAEILSSGGNQCVIRAVTPGSAVIYVESKEWNCGSVKNVEVGNEFADVDAFYRCLSRIPVDESPMADPDVDRMVRSELLRVIGNRDRANRIADVVRDAPVVYQQLYLWSFFDYMRDANPERGGSYHWGGRMQVDTDSIDVWFHESGHAVAYALNDQDITESDQYKDRLYSGIYYRIYQIVAREVLEQARGTKLTSEEKFAVIESIMGAEYKFRVKKFIIWGSYRDSEVKPRDDFSEEQKALFNDSVNAIRKILDDHPVESNGNSSMFEDMFAGCTNQTVMGNSNFIHNPRGHGPLAHEYGDPEIYRADYWYTADMKPTYAQNAEGWAEFFSGMMTGHNREDNRNNFEEACELMDEIAAELLNGYREKHMRDLTP